MSHEKTTTRGTNAGAAVTTSDWRTLRIALRLVWRVVDRYAKRRLLRALLLIAGGAVVAALTPIALKLAIDGLTAGSMEPAILGPLALVALYVAGQYATRSITELRMLTFVQAEARVRRHISRHLFEHLLRLPLRFHLERKIGAMGQTAEQGIRGYQLLLTHTIYSILPIAIEFVAIAIVLLHFERLLYLGILVVAAAAYFVAFWRNAVDVRTSTTAISESTIEAHSVFTDSLMNCESIKYFDAEPVISSRYDAVLGKTEFASCLFQRQRTMNGLLLATIFAAALGVSLIHAVYDVLRGAMTVGDLVLVNAYVVRLIQPLELLGLVVRETIQGVAFLRRMLELFSETPERDVRSNHAEAAGSRGELAFEDVSFSYREDKCVLRRVSFRVPAGRTVAVVGVSGSGKSSLIRLLFRLYEPAGGRILLDGVPISQMALSAVRQAIAVVPQDTVLFHDTIANNIGFGRFGASRHEIEEAAKVARLHEFIIGLPEGYETVVGERGMKLSGGERQRVAIARATLKRPKIYVFDEATSSLDSRTEKEILSNLEDVSSRCTTLVIAHRLSTVVHADEILVLDHGVIVERGTHDQLRELGGYYSALWEAQQGEASKQGGVAISAA